MDVGVTYLIPFTFLILQKPNIASLVRSFCIRDSFGHKDMLIPPTSSNGDAAQKKVDEGARKGWPSHPDLDGILGKAVEDIESEEEEKSKLFEEVRAGSDEGAILSILLPKLTSLRKLDLVHGWEDDARHLVRLLHKVTKREAPFDRYDNSAFANLSDVLIAGYDDKYPNAPDWFGAYLELPGIRRLYGYQMGNNTQEEITPTMAALGIGTSPVEELELRESKLYAEDLERILRACKNLKTFIYEVGHAWAWYPLQTSDIRKALSLQERTLENLVLDHPDYLEGMDGDDLSPISFAAFRNLVYLKVSTLFLGGEKGRSDCDLTGTFPETLKTLHVTYVGEPWHCAKTVDGLLRVLQQKEVLPRLEKLTLEGDFQKYPERLDRVKEIVRCAKEKDIETVIVNSAGFGAVLEKGWGLDGSVQWQECFNNKSNQVEILDIKGFGW